MNAPADSADCEAVLQAVDHSCSHCASCAGSVCLPGGGLAIWIDLQPLGLDLRRR
jgi:hypothetical protein